MRTMSIDLTDDQAALLDEAAATGEYATPNDAILEAMEEWQGKRQLQLLMDDNERMRALWEEGIASGSAGPVDFDATLKKARARLAEAKLHAA